MRNENLKKILKLDEEFDKARDANDILTATKISAQMELVEPSLTPREYYRYLTLQIMKLTENTLREIDRATSRIYNGKDIEGKIEAAQHILQSMLTHLGADDVEEASMPESPFIINNVPSSPQ